MFDRLAGQSQLRHGVSLRRQNNPSANDPAMLLDFDFSSNNPDRFRANLAWFCKAVGLTEERAVVAHQIHGSSVAVIHRPAQAVTPADALCTNMADVPLVLRGADCPLVLIYDPDAPAVGLAHAGWRGTVQKIVIHLVETMTRQFRCIPARMLAGIGPGICRRCYQVGSEVAQAVRQNLSDPEKFLSPGDDRLAPALQNKWYLDLFEANRRQLLQAGLAEQNIEISPLCTYEEQEKFYSYRRQGDAAGRWALLAGLA
jgi:polyphenol oxidase